MKSGDFEDIQRRMDGAITAFKHDLASLRTGRASRNLLDADPGQGLWLRHAAQPGGDDLGAGAAHDLGLGLGQVDGRRGRPRHPRGQSRLQPDHRRHQSAHPAARAQRAAPQGTGQGRPRLCRERPRRGAPCPPRRHGPPEKGREGWRHQRGRSPPPVRPGPEADRRDDFEVDSLLAGKEAEIMQV